MNQETRSHFKLALIQMRIQPGEVVENTRHAEALIHQAADQGAEVILLPEALPFGWTHPSARQYAEPIPDGHFTHALLEAAARHRIHICSGLVERDSRNGRIYNSAILVSPERGILLHHRKIHELNIAKDLYSTGNSLEVAETPWGRMGIMICADAFIEGQVLSRSLAAMGARAILSPCAWAVTPDHDNQQNPYGQLWKDHYGSVAHRFGIWIAGVSNVGPITEGPWKGRHCIGNSLMVDPSGTPSLQGPYGIEAEAILIQEVTLSPEPIRGTS